MKDFFPPGRLALIPGAFWPYLGALSTAPCRGSSGPFCKVLPAVLAGQRHCWCHFSAVPECNKSAVFSLICAGVLCAGLGSRALSCSCAVSSGAYPHVHGPGSALAQLGALACCPSLAWVKLSQQLEWQAC